MKKSLKLFIVLLFLIVAIGIFLFVLTEKWMSDGLTEKADGTNEYAIVLGAKVNLDGPSLTLKYRLQEALTYAQEYPQVQLLLSGGQGADEPMSEAEAMRKYLVANGIEEGRLILESESTSTYENLLNSKQLLPSTVQSLTIITSDFHVARAKMIAKRLDIETDAVGAKTPEVVEVQSRMRERAALIKTYIIGK